MAIIVSNFRGKGIQKKDRPPQERSQKRRGE